MKKLLMLTMIALMLVAFGVATAEAANPATIGVTVTVTKTLSVSVTPSSWAVGSSVAESSVSSTANGVTAFFTATNNGNSSENLTTTVGASSPSGWAAGAAAGTDIYVMKQSKDLGVGWTLIDPSTGASLATSLAKGGTQGFDLQFTAPSSTDDGGTAQTITTTVTAS